MPTGKTLNGKRLRQTIIASVVCACGAMAATAETFCWKPGTNAVNNAWFNFGEPANWLIPDPNGSNPNGLVPGPEDSIYGSRHGCWNLESKTWAVKEWLSLLDGERHYTYVTNGTLVVTERLSTRRYNVVLRSGATLSFPAGSVLNGGEGDGGNSNHYMEIGKGAMLDVHGTLEPYNYYLGINPGGMAVIDPEDFHMASTTREKNNTIYVQGTALFPHGLVWTGGGANGNARFTILLRGGTIVAAGDFSRNGKTGSFKVTLEDQPEGGTFEATDDVTFSGVDEAYVNYGMNFNVHDGATLDMTPFTFLANKTKACRKVGNGVLRLGASLPAGLIVSDGTVSLSSQFNGLPGFSFLNAGVKLRVEAAGSRLDSIDVPTQKGNLSFECGFDLAQVQLNTPIFSSADADILERARDGFKKTCPEDRTITIVDGALVCADSGLRMIVR